MYCDCPAAQGRAPHEIDGPSGLRELRHYYDQLEDDARVVGVGEDNGDVVVSLCNITLVRKSRDWFEKEMKSASTVGI